MTVARDLARSHRPAMAVLALLALVGTAASAQTRENRAVALEEIRVTSARLEGVSPFAVPASVSTVDLSQDRNRADVNLSEVLNGVPGLVARDRQNFAQDTQLSIRGFGARSTFGVRGVRLYADGIPATMPDGQGQVSHFSLAAAERVEVLRGPFSVLHGNSSGGVVQLWSADGRSPGSWRVRGTAGRFDTQTLSARVLGASGGFDYNVAASRFETDGFREHSAARRESGNAKLGIALNDEGRIELVLNHFDSPQAQDPLGLTADQVREDPRQATAEASQFDTRKSVRQDQLGAVFTQSFGSAHTLRVAAHGGQRDVVQFLAIPPAAQSNPLSAGGVVDLASDYGGLDARWTWQGHLLGREAEFALGANTEQQEQDRRGYENFLGSTLGVRGRLRRDERNIVRNLDEYAQLWWQVAPRWALLAGVRHSSVRFRAEDDFITASNPDDSGSVRYNETTPVAGLSFALHDDLRLHAAIGRGFETPTFNELGYRADGGTGLAFDLEPAVSRNVELGLKWRDRDGARFEAALFRADTDDELAVARNVGGRSSFRNVGRARREGLEAAYARPFGAAWQLDLAYTRIAARFRDTFPICTAAGCTSPTQVVAANTRIPGVPRDQIAAQVRWRNAGWTVTAEALGLGNTTANDPGTARAAGYALLNFELSRTWRFSRDRLRTFARIDNAFDTDYIGSVIVNEGNARFYEPGPGRTVMVGVEWNWGVQ